MPFIHVNYNNWQFWRDSDGPNYAYGGGNKCYSGQKVTFDPYNKWILINEGETEIEVKADIYSAWKEWVTVSPEDPLPGAWPIAISAIGGDQIEANTFVGTSFFLENGWRIKPYTTNVGYVLSIKGNIYTRESGQNPVIPESGVTVNLVRSSIVDATTFEFDEILGSISITEEVKADIARLVWERTRANPTVGSYGELVNNIDSDLTNVKTEVDKTLKTKEYLAFQK